VEIVSYRLVVKMMNKKPVRSRLSHVLVQESIESQAVVTWQVILVVK
jgi:hypothetical protein